METKFAIAIVLCILFSFIIWRLTKDLLKKEYGDKNWVASLFYWQAVVYAGAGIAYLIMVLLKRANVLNI